MDLRTYSEQRIGETWTEADHVYLDIQLRKIDQLAQELARLNGKPTPQVVAA